MTDDGSDRRQAGRELMARVYGWDEAPDVPGDFFAMTAEHLFGTVWSRDGLSMRDRRLLLLGLLVGLGEHDVVGLQVDAALHNGELSADELREIVIFLTHYAGWPRGAALNTLVERAIGKRRREEEGAT
ncbi:MAG TPA: carboxymuconolactone decarboxylase family protein [Mycobacteriales bacterium]|nr:carboxymuconolactone decarboxylase family protein [Mycobacteriales bacterium]